MDLLQAAIQVQNIAKDDNSNILIHETKYALLGVTLFILFTIPGTNALIINVFPKANSPLLHIYKILFFISIYYVVQKSAWFQKL